VTAEFGECPTAAAGTYLLVVTGTDAVSGALSWYDLTAAAGCTTGPSLSFGDPPAAGRIAAQGVVACQAVPAQPGDRERFTFGPSVQDVVFHAWLLTSTGQQTCEFDSDDLFPANCSVSSSQPPDAARVVVWADEAEGTARTGQFRLHGWRLTEPAGCADGGSLHNGLGPLVGTLGDRNDEVCYALRARHGTLAVTTSNDDVAADVPVAELHKPSGALICTVQGTGTCSLDAAGPAPVLVVRRGDRPQDGDFAGTFRIEGTCTSGACGP
jgi:hypothetical protein